MTRVILDANLLLVYSIGRRHPELLGKHHRATAYMPEDFDLLIRLLERFEQIIVTPNAITECSDLLSDSSRDEHAKQSLKELIEFPECVVAEKYIPSRSAVVCSQYRYLGISDCAMLCLVDSNTLLLSTDGHLVAEAQRINSASINFNHWRNFQPSA